MKPPPPILNPLRLAAAVGKKFFQVRKPPAQSPGSLIHVGEKRVEHVAISLVEFDEAGARFLETDKIEDCLPFAGNEQVVWIQITGLHDVEKIGELGESFGIHPLILEDILNTSSRPKIEDLDEYLFVVSKLITFDEENRIVDVQHFSLLMLPDSSVLTFLEAPTPVFDPVRQRIRSGGGGRIRTAGPDYLAWALMDAVVDHYFRVIDGVDEIINTLDDQIQADTNSVAPGDLFDLKKEVTALHRLVRPIREIVAVLHRSESALLTSYSRPYYRDLNDHAVHLLEHTEELRDLVTSLRDFYMTAASNRMNEVMKVLTSFATIFLPLTFLAGIYGMNFQDMPELQWPWAYPALWAVFLIVAGGMSWFFRRKKWI